MNKKALHGVLTLLAAISLVAFLSSCDAAGSGENGNWGIMRLSLTDAPIMADGVNGVYITVEEIRYNSGEEEWVPAQGFDGPKTYNLLELQNGKTALLGDLVLPAGEYEQIRLMLGVSESAASKKGPPVTAGSWVEFGTNDTYDPDTDKDQPLFVPSGAQSGYKATAEEPFTVPANGMIEITADFDLRRSVVVAGNSGRYLLKPVLRLVVNEEVGQIVGDVSNIDPEFRYVAYAYTAGAYNVGEEEENDQGVRFPNAVTSSEIVVSSKDFDYVLSFLPTGTYSVVVAEYKGDTFKRARALGLGVEVTAGSTTVKRLDVARL